MTETKLNYSAGAVEALLHADLKEGQTAKSTPKMFALSKGKAHPVIRFLVSGPSGAVVTLEVFKKGSYDNLQPAGTIELRPEAQVIQWEPDTANNRGWRVAVAWPCRSATSGNKGRITVLAQGHSDG